ncbi:hypothetical protein HYFRA_00013142 [Hymenoscyphus fraxineus]|uniref:Uncharacterized protein n=1 Tax=Hymenoscyphus fraxineus TaxID=746836 RepID=A0A9N9PXZ7_9HELO|nr:hypothetical protein HYFRA_00013142 [Hymenoscyphus fraxineus]
MAGSADTLRGNGLVRAHTALEGLEGNPRQLDRERQRFSQSPPSYTSDPSGTVTRPASPIPPSEELRQQRRMQLAGEREASLPYNQFEQQVEEERKRIWDADLHGTQRIPLGSDPYTIATEVIKKRWIEQGIWKNTWNKFAAGRWKHEEPLEIESESESELETAGDLETETSRAPPLFFLVPKPELKPRQPKSDAEKRRTAERRVVREREREASRPYHQLIYQISKERERIQGEFANDGGADIADINTRAYENVMNTWTKRGLWNKKWGVLPGMSWKHEQPLEEMVREEMGDDPVPANPLRIDCHDAPGIRLFGVSPAQSDFFLNSYQQEPSSAIASAGSENGDVERSSSLNSYPPSFGERLLRATTGQALLPSERKASPKDIQPANVSVGPVHPSKVTKATEKRKGPQRRLSISQGVSSDGSPLSSGVNRAEPQPVPVPAPNAATPRRSQRIQPSVSSGVNDPARSSTKPPWASKQQLWKTAQGKAR